MPDDVKEEVKKQSAEEQAQGAGSAPQQPDAAAAATGPEGAQAHAKRAKARGRAVPVGVAHIKATFNNTTVSITDLKGNVIAWSSCGRAGFKGSRKSTAFAATVVGQEAAKQALARGMHEVEVQVQGAGAGRESAIRALQAAGLSITMIRDETPVPHNGCRPRKRRRV